MCIFFYAPAEDADGEKSLERKDVALKHVAMAEYLQGSASVSPFELRGLALHRKESWSQGIE